MRPEIQNGHHRGTCYVQSKDKAKIESSSAICKALRNHEGNVEIYEIV